MTLYQWQQEALARFARAAYFALVVDCGLGKTLAAIAIAKEKRRSTLVITPGHDLCVQWRDEILSAAGSDEGEIEDVWVYSRTEETKRGEAYREEFIAWLNG
jgi:superfamily II DNA or RNA helicase